MIKNLRFACIDGTHNMSKFNKKFILNKNICIYNIPFGDHIFYQHVQFPNAENIIINNCNKNYVYAHVNEDIYPNLKNLYLLSHPCEKLTLWRFNRNDNITIYLSKMYEKYKHRWARDRENIKIIDIYHSDLSPKNLEHETIKY